MSTELILWTVEDLSAPWIWWQSQAQCGIVKTEAEKANLKSLDFKSLSVIIPGQSVRIYKHDLPDMRPSERKKATQIFMEDLIAGPSKDQHFVMGSHKRIAVTGLAQMQALTGALKQLGLSAQKIIADYESLPLSLGSVALSDRLIKPGPDGFTVDTNWVETDPVIKAELGALMSADPYDLLARVNTETATNLASGDFAPKQALMSTLNSFKRAAVLLFVLGLSWLCWQGTQWRANKAHAEALRAETSDLYFKATGKRAANPALEVTRALKSSPQSKGSFLQLSSILFSSLSKIDGVELDRLQYDDKTNALSLRIYYPGFETVTQLEKAIAQSGATFESGGVREQSGRMIGEAQLSFGGGS